MVKRKKSKLNKMVFDRLKIMMKTKIIKYYIIIQDIPNIKLIVFHDMKSLRIFIQRYSWIIIYPKYKKLDLHLKLISNKRLDELNALKLKALNLSIDYIVNIDSKTNLISNSSDFLVFGYNKTLKIYDFINIYLKEIKKTNLNEKIPNINTIEKLVPLNNEIKETNVLQIIFLIYLEESRLSNNKISYLKELGKIIINIFEPLCLYQDSLIIIDNPKYLDFVKFYYLYLISISFFHITTLICTYTLIKYIKLRINQFLDNIFQKQIKLNELEKPNIMEKKILNINILWNINLSKNRISDLNIFGKMKLKKFIKLYINNNNLSRKELPNILENIELKENFNNDNNKLKFEINERKTKNIDNKNIKNNNKEKNNTIIKDKIYKNKKLIQNNTSKNNILNNYISGNNNKSKNGFDIYSPKRIQILNYLIIFILICNTYSINSKINLVNKKISNHFIYYSYEITLKVNGIGLKNILSSSYSNTNPSKIYLNDEMVENILDFHKINITEQDTEIKIEWNNIVVGSIKNMFYNCKDIVEIDMTKFDTSQVTDMSEMFSLCSSLKSINVSNLITTNVQTMENMFYKCTDLTSLNLESFTIQKVTSLYRMFYDCKNLEYINIKNFEEYYNINKDEMFYNIAPNAVICLPCQPPTNFTIISMTTTEVTISWVRKGDINNFIISYGLKSLLNPDNGNKITVNNQEYYTITNLNSGKNYDVYIRTNCGSKFSSWFGPLSVNIGSYIMSHTGSTSITSCSKIIYDPGGPNGQYSDGDNTILTIYPETSKELVTIKGSIDLENNYDYLKIYNGIGTNGILFGSYTSAQSIPLIVSTTGPLTIKFTTDGSVIRSGYQLTIGCMHISETIYDLINKNSCYKISNDLTNWRNIQKLIVPNSEECINNCQLTSYKYQYRGKCYNNCPLDTIDMNFKCYSKNVIEKCEEYSMESESDNLCIKCKTNYYPMLNDKNNKNNFMNCYKNNSLEKYYLDQNNLIFKLCYKTCKTCIQDGTKENHYCLICDINHEFNLNMGGYYNCYPKCDYYFYLDNQKNFICLNKNECPKDYNNLIEEKKQCIEECNKDNEYKYQFRKKCFKKCPIELSYESEIKPYFCEVICNKETPLEIIEYQNCTDFCGINEMNNKLCISKYQDENTNGNLILNNILQDITSTNFDINILNNNKNIIINESFIDFIITNNKIQKNVENKIINLGKCENILKNVYSIRNDEDLVIFLININKKDEQIKKLVYEVYSKTDTNKLIKLDLNLCKDIIVDNINLLDNNYIIKCEKYSIDSILIDSCVTCHQPYFPKYDDILNGEKLVKCYEKLDGYYLDKNKYFKKCYKSCDLCEEKGNDSEHNCTKCKTDYFYELNISSYINCYQKCEFNFYYNEINKKYYCTPDNNCIDFFDKLIPENKQCVKNCKMYPDFPLEFQKTCYNSCPKNISELSEDKNYCKAKCPKDFPYEILETQKCVKKCSIMEINHQLCKLNFKSDNKSETNDAQEKLGENIKEEMTNGMDTSEIDKGKDIIIQEEDITIIISKDNNQKNEINSKTNNTNIDFGECEKKIRKKYNILKNESLYILKMDVKQDGYKIPKIQYEVYYPLNSHNNDSKLYLLNLSICEDVNIDIYLPVLLNISLDKIDPNSKYFNDICNTFTSDDGTDLTLSERKKNYIKNNLSVCEENCQFEGYNETIGKAKCSCQVKTNFITKISENNFNQEELYKSFTDFNNIFNIKVIKCIDLIFSIKAFRENYANIILIVIILLYFICLIIFICKSYNNEIKFNINIIIYFTLFPNKILYIIQKKKKEEIKNSYVFKINYNINNNINKIISVNNTNIYKNNNNNNKNEEIKGINKLKNIKLKNRIITLNKVKPPAFKKIFEKLLKNNIKKSKNSNPVKKSLNSNFMKRVNKNTKTKTEDELIKKMKIEEKMNQKYKKYYNHIFEQFNNLPEIYELHQKIYTKTDRELNNLQYKDALKYDNRTFFEYYVSLIRSKHLLFFSFYPRFDFNSRILKMYLFFFNFTTYFFVNSLFFTDKTMGKINIDRGSFNFIYNLPQIIYSTIISSIINEIIRILALTEMNFIEYRNKAKRENIFKVSNSYNSNLKIKFIIFFILNLLFLGLYWIYLSCFCAVYKNTQLYLIKDTLISFGTSLIYPIAIYLLPGMFRIPSLRKKNRRIMYGINKILQLL